MRRSSEERNAPKKTRLRWLLFTGCNVLKVLWKTQPQIVQQHGRYSDVKSNMMIWYCDNGLSCSHSPFVRRPWSSSTICQLLYMQQANLSEDGWNGHSLQFVSVVSQPTWWATEIFKSSKPTVYKCQDVSSLKSFFWVPNSPMSPPLRMKKVIVAQMENGGVSAESARFAVALEWWGLERIYVCWVDKPVWWCELWIDMPLGFCCKKIYQYWSDDFFNCTFED